MGAVDDLRARAERGAVRPGDRLITLRDERPRVTSVKRFLMRLRYPNGATGAANVVMASREQGFYRIVGERVGWVAAYTDGSGTRHWWGPDGWTVDRGAALVILGSRRNARKRLGVGGKMLAPLIARVRYLPGYAPRKGA